MLEVIGAGFGRTGTLWGFEHFDIFPDILVLGKALGGGLPLGAFIADKKKLDLLTENPALGHITTFGGHPLCCAAGMASMEVILNEKLVGIQRHPEHIRTGVWNSKKFQHRHRSRWPSTSRLRSTRQSASP